MCGLLITFNSEALTFRTCIILLQCIGKFFSCIYVFKVLRCLIGIFTPLRNFHMFGETQICVF